MPVELWLAYLVLSFLFAVTPGPAVLLTAGRAIARGFWAGIRGRSRHPGRQPRLFLSCPQPVWRAIAVASETALRDGQICRRRLSDLARHPHDPQCPQGAAPGGSGTRDGLAPSLHPGLVNQLANPKSILFWGALFPQFVDYRADNLVISSRSSPQPASSPTSSSLSTLCGGGREWRPHSAPQAAPPSGANGSPAPPDRSSAALSLVSAPPERQNCHAPTARIRTPHGNDDRRTGAAPPAGAAGRRREEDRGAACQGAG